MAIALRSSAPLVARGIAASATVVIVALLGGCSDGGEVADLSNITEGGATAAFQPAGIDGDALPPTTEGGADPAVGRTIPSVIGMSFDGTTVKIEPGEPQVIAFLAHWCPHCQAEVPLIVGWQESGELEDDVKLIGVSTSANEAQGNFPPASWLEREAWTNPTLADTPRNEVLNAFGVSQFPTLIAVTADGKVAQRASGELTLDQVQQLWDAARG